MQELVVELLALFPSILLPAGSLGSWAGGSFVPPIETHGTDLITPHDLCPVLRSEGGEALTGPKVGTDILLVESSYE